MLGLEQDSPDVRDFVKKTRSGSAPEAFNISSRVPHIQPYEQGRTQACTGYAGAMFVRLLYGQRFNRGRGIWKASPLFLYYNARVEAGNEKRDTGARLRDLLKGMHKIGIAPEGFHDATKAVTDPPDAQAVRSAALLRIRKYERIFVGPDAPDHMVRTISLERLPILIGAEMPASVGKSPTREDGRIRLPEAGESTLGPHALVIDGYDTTEHVFTGWNSWGQAWGSGGRFCMEFEWFTRPELTYDVWTCAVNYW